MADTPKLKRVTRLDSIPVNKAEWTAEGFLIDVPILTSVGIFEYTNPDGTIRRELRLPENVFDPESLASYKGKPVIITHSAGIVTSDNTADETIGAILSDGIPDGGSVRAEIVIHDTDAMKRSGLKELSLGYNLVLDETPGEWNGQKYDAVQTDIRINHLALVSKARAGEEARLNIDGKDNQISKSGGKLIMTKNDKKQAMNADDYKKIIAAYETRRKARLDGQEEPSAIPEKIIIEGEVKKSEGEAESPEGIVKEMTLEKKVEEVKDRRDKRDGFGDPADVEGAKGIIAQQDEDISVLLELLEKLQAAKDLAASPQSENADVKKDGGGESKPMNTDSFDAIVTERLELARIGDKLNLDGIERLKPLDAKKKIIGKIKPELRLDGKSASYVETAFDIAIGEYNSRKDADYQRRQMFSADGNDEMKKTALSGAEEARMKYAKRIYNGGIE